MIWVGGEIVPDAALKISVLDRTFEHGLGLFETLRTWNGRAVLLDRHLSRMKTSAGILGLPIGEQTLPSQEDVEALADANELHDDCLLRITCSGGRPGVVPSIVWMSAQELPPPYPLKGISLVPLVADSAPWNPLPAHKTLNYWPNRLAHLHVTRVDRSSEALLVDSQGLVREGSRTNLFAVRHNRLLTPRPESSTHQPLLLPGIMRQLVIERARNCDLTLRTENLSLNSLRTASEIFMTNAVRGIIPVCQLEGREFDAPGPVTMKIRNEVWGWLNRGGVD